MKTKIMNVIDLLTGILLIVTIGSLVALIIYSIQANNLAAGTMDMYTFIDWCNLQNQANTFKGITLDLAMTTAGLWTVGRILRIED